MGVGRAGWYDNCSTNLRRTSNGLIHSTIKTNDRGSRMIGRLYTADEIFNALREATEQAVEEMLEQCFPDDGDEKADSAARSITIIGGNIAYNTAEILKFDMDQLSDYCKKKLEEEDD